MTLHLISSFDKTYIYIRFDETLEMSKSEMVSNVYGENCFKP